ADWRRDEEPVSAAAGRPAGPASFASSIRVPAVWLGMGMFTACVGLELGVAQWAYTLLAGPRGFRPAVAGLLVGAHWAAFTGGRILFGLVVADRFAPDRLLRVLMSAMVAGAVLFW